ncbi:MAG TPA: ABC transporter permease [Terriglobia bacterium]|nr:ABC transporter permease [Terriglobia bacterium]
MEAFLQDLRYSFRLLSKSPGFTAIAVITLALGIGANSTIFSWIDSTLLNPIPGVTHTGDLYTWMRGDRSEHPSPPFSYLDYRDLRDHTQTFSGVLGYHDDYITLTGVAKPERIFGALTSANYFDVLGARPQLGRGFLPAEELSPGATVAVISDSLWRTHFEADRSVIGRSIQLNRRLYTIIGVAPPDFQGCKTGLRTDLWIPLGMDRFVWHSDRPADRATFWLNVLGRLKPGVGPRQANQELNLLMQRIVEHSPDAHQGPNQMSLDPLWRSPFGANVYLYQTLPTLLALAGALLLLACANVANLLLVRSVGRRREIALRLAMGAGRWRLVRQFLVESLALALAGGAVAVLITFWTAGTFDHFIPPLTIPVDLNGHLSASVFLATLGASFVTSVIFGILPALRSSGISPVTVLKEEALSVSGGLHKARLSSALVVMQIALSVVLLVCAGLFLRSLQRVETINPGFDPNHVLIASYELGPAGYARSAAFEFDRQVLAKVGALPGVESATLADFAPLTFSLHSQDVQAEGYVPRPHESLEIDRADVGPNYLATLRVPLIAGRDVAPQDTEKSQPVALVNQAFVERYWRGQDPLGKRLFTDGRWYTVVGEAANGKYRRMIYAPEPAVYLPLFQDYRDTVTLHVRTAGDPLGVAPAVEKAVHELDPDLPVFGIARLKAAMEMGSVFERVAAAFVGAFGFLALALAAVGIYGVVSYTTRQRTHEFGIRMALGAERGDVLRLVLGQGLRMTIVGVVFGLAASWAVTRFLGSLLLGVTATDAFTYAAVALLLGGVALSACYFPARRATTVNPSVALHSE